MNAAFRWRAVCVTRALSHHWLGPSVFLVALGLRFFHLQRAYDVFLDELTYSRISAGVAVDGKVVFGNFPFYLHSPLSFYWQALLIKIFSIDGTAVQVVQSLRIANVVVGSLIAVLMFSLVSKVSSRRWGLLGAALFSFDPFIISFDSRLFLEAFTMLWIVAGYLVLLPFTRMPSGMQKRFALRAVGGGFLFGLSLLSKEESAPLYVVPLLWCIVRGDPLPRHIAATSLGTAVATYIPYPIIAVVTGGGSQFVQQKFNGIERLLGIIQATGFNRPGAPSLLSRLTANLDVFVVTYLLMGFGALGVVYLMRRGTRTQRLIAIWGGGAYAMLIFQVAKGTLEEQMFYDLVVPAIAVLATSGAQIVSTVSDKGWSAAATLVAVVIVGFDLVVWTSVHTGTDQALVKSTAWFERHVPAGTRVAPLADAGQLVLPKYVLQFNPEAGLVSPSDLRLARTQVVVTSSLQVNQGYSAATPHLIKWLHAHARRRFAASGATYGTIVIWQLSRRLPHTASPGAERLEPRASLSLGAAKYRG